MARKKSKGSKKARSKKSRAKKKSRPEASSEADTTSKASASEQADAAEEVSPEASGSGKKTRKKRSGKRAPKKASGKHPETQESEARNEAPEAPEPEPPEAGDLEHDSGSGTGRPDDDVEAVRIDVDDELDDEDARLRLIAETLALAAEEGDSEEARAEILEIADTLLATAGPGAEESAEGGVDSKAAEAADHEVDEATVGASDEAAHDAPTASGSTGEDRPLIGAQALLALSEIHAEGLASLPGEVVLDLGETTTPEERDRLLAAALAHAEMQEAVYRLPTATNRILWAKLGIAAVIAFAALVVGVRPPALVVPEAPPGLSAADVARGVRVALLLQAEQIEAYRVVNGALPRSLADVAVRLPDIRFVRSNNRAYQLVAYTVQGEAVVFDSAAPEPEFDALRREWITTREDS